MDETQKIFNNHQSQIIFSLSSYGQYLHWNVIGDSNSRETPHIKVVDYEEMNDTTQGDHLTLPDTMDVENNCWINDYDPEERLIPVGTGPHSGALENLN